MRSFPSLKRQKNFTGLYYAATMDAHVGFESWLERDVAMTRTSTPGGWRSLPSRSGCGGQKTASSARQEPLRRTG